MIENIKHFDANIGGFPKCGTTTMLHYLKQHPKIFALEKNIEEYKKKKTRKRIKLFRGGGIDTVLIRKGGLELFKERVENVYDINPDLKVIILMRDPIRRAQSQYWHRMITSGISISFEEALKTTEEQDILELGEYKKFVKCLEKFDTFYIISEELWEKKMEILGKLYDFLGVDYFEPEEKRKNKSGEPRIKFLTHLTTGEIKMPIISEHFPEILPILRKGVNIFNVKDSYPPLDKKTKSYLIEYYREKNKGLGKMIDKDLSQWWEWWETDKSI